MPSDTTKAAGKFFGAASCVAARSCATPAKTKAARSEHFSARVIFMVSPPAWLGHLLRQALQAPYFQNPAQVKSAADRASAAASALPSPRRASPEPRPKPALARFPLRKRR